MVFAIPNDSNKRFDMDTDQKISYSNRPVIKETPVVDFNSIKVGVKTLDDAVFKLGDLRKTNPRLADKCSVLRAIDNYDLKTMREISNFFYRTSGIYARIVRYMAFLYRYDWYVTPYVKDKKYKNEKLITNFDNVLSTLDNFGVKKTLGEIALKTLLNGCYYGYKVPTAKKIVLQELPQDYCRSRFNYGDQPAVEFNMRYFDDKFGTVAQRMAILKLFPKEFQKGYVLYKKGKLPPQFSGDTSGWYLLDPKMTVKFTVNGEDYPPFIAVIPLLIDLDEAQAIDKQRTLQKLLKIVIQKMPFDKNGDLIFDMDEAQQLHNNAVKMLADAIGVKVLTTFADVDVADMAEDSATKTDDLERIERQVYNEAGMSLNLFNTTGNTALEKSIMNDEATMYNLLLQFEDFLNSLLDPFNTAPKKVVYKVQLLTTTIYNYKELSKLYKEQTQLGYSKMLPQIALGQSQSSILATAHFETEVLDLVNLFIPPMMSSTMNADALNQVNNSKGAAPKIEEKQVGRKELDDDKKSDKTLQNRESMS